MADLILHHYPTSPFAEKVRLMLGYKKLAWKSVMIPMVMPKPDVVALTGGYRKTPILQIGADIYCDTALIADVLEHLPAAPAEAPLFRPRAAAPEHVPPPPEPEGEAGQVLELLGPAPISVDELARRCQLSVRSLRAILLDLELEGRVQSLPGNRVALL